MLLCSQEGDQSSEGAAGWCLDVVWEKHKQPSLLGTRAGQTCPGASCTASCLA